jgi:hypothetical protein
MLFDAGHAFSGAPRERTVLGTEIEGSRAPAERAESSCG